MSLRVQAESDLASILENKADFGWDITLVSPQSVSYNLVGYSNDVGLVMDPQTGQMIAGRDVSVALRTSSLAGIPVVGVMAGKPWVLRFADINGATGTFRVTRVIPDRTLGITVLKADVYAASPN